MPEYEVPLGSRKMIGAVGSAQHPERPLSERWIGISNADDPDNPGTDVLAGLPAVADVLADYSHPAESARLDGLNDAGDDAADANPYMIIRRDPTYNQVIVPVIGVVGGSTEDKAFDIAVYGVIDAKKETASQFRRAFLFSGRVTAGATPVGADDFLYDELDPLTELHYCDTWAEAESGVPSPGVRVITNFTGGGLGLMFDALSYPMLLVYAVPVAAATGGLHVLTGYTRQF